MVLLQNVNRIIILIIISNVDVMTRWVNANKVLLSPCVCWVVCQQDFTKTTERISKKLGWRMGLGPEQAPLTFDVEERIDPVIISHFP